MQKVRHNKYSICVTILGFSCENGRMIHNIVTKMDEVKKVKWLLLFITKIFVCLYLMTFRYQRAQVIFTQNVYFFVFHASNVILGKFKLFSRKHFR